MTTSTSPIEFTLLQSVDRVLARAIESNRVPGVVAAVCDASSRRYLAAFGNSASDPERPMVIDTVVRIASMTKLVTSVAVMILVEEGRVDLDVPLATYVPGFRQPQVLVSFDASSGHYETRPAARDASLRELLSHTAGYGYWWLNEPLRIASGVSPNLLDPPFLVSDPGTGFIYSTSTDVIGRLFEPVTGLELDQFFEARIFEPLGMRDTGFRRPRDLTRLAHVHRRVNGGHRQLKLEDQDHEVRAGGGLYSTAIDYERFLRCLLRGGELDGVRLLRDSSVEEIRTNQIGEAMADMQRTALADRSNDFVFMDGSQKFGLGVMIETSDRPGKRSRGAYGWGGIVNTYFWVDPVAGLAAVLMMQVAPFATRACIELLDEFELAVYSDWRA